MAEQGAEGTLIDENYSVSLLTEGTQTFDFEKGFFSLFDFKGDAIVSVSGAKYPLEKASLPSCATLGISNEGTGHTQITVHQGKLFLVREK